MYGMALGTNPILALYLDPLANITRAGLLVADGSNVELNSLLFELITFLSWPCRIRQPPFR